MTSTSITDKETVWLKGYIFFIYILYIDWCILSVNNNTVDVSYVAHLIIKLLRNIKFRLIQSIPNDCIRGLIKKYKDFFHSFVI